MLSQDLAQVPKSVWQGVYTEMHVDNSEVWVVDLEVYADTAALARPMTSDASS